MKWSTRIRSKLFCAFAILTISSSLSSSAFGAEKGVARHTYDTLKQIEQLQHSGKSQLAVRKLEKLANSLNDNSYDKAVVLQYLAYAYNTTGKPKQAQKTAQKALATKQNSPAVNQSLLYLLAQTSFQTEAFEQGVGYIQRWLKAVPEPTAEGLYLAGYGNFRLKRYQLAAKYLKRAVVTKANAPVDWYQILLAVLIEQKRYQAAVPIVEKLIAREPSDANLWRTLASLYLQQNNRQKALASLALAKHTTKPRSDRIRQMVGLSVSLGMPDYAARMLNDSLQRGRLQKSYDNLKLLYQCWSLAREYDKAEKILSQAAAMTNNGEDYLLLGRLHFEQHDWKNAQIALKKALRKGHLKRPKQAKLLLGICACHTGEKTAAKKYLEKLVTDPEYKRVASYWLSRLKNS